MNEKTRAMKAELIEKIADAVADRFSGPLSTLARVFVEHYYSRVAYEDMIEMGRNDLEGSALAIFSFAQKRTPRSPKIRVYNPTHEEHGWRSTHTIVEVVNDDMSFLVDSTVAALNNQDLTVHLLIHPVIRLGRDADGRLASVDGADDPVESIMHVEVSRQATAEQLQAIHDNLAGVLRDVRAAVEDWQPMTDRLREIIDDLARNPPPLPEDDVAESQAFLEWIHNDNFTFLGFRDYRLKSEEERDYLEIIPGSGLGILREVSEESARRHAAPLPRHLARVARRKELLILTTASARSRVHRPVYMDYLGIRRFGEDGEVVGESRFLGLFTAAAYNRNPSEIPLLRRKVERVIERAGYRSGGHDAKKLQNILETYPRNELFQISEDELFEIAEGIRHLEERQRIRLFVRRDSYARFFSCLVYAPRERYNTQLRERFEEILTQAFGGTAVEFTTRISDSPMARVHFIVRTGAKPPSFDVAEIEAKLVEASRRWTDDLRDALIEAWGEGRGTALYHRYQEAFEAGYSVRFPARTAAADVAKIERVRDTGDIAMGLYRPLESPEKRVHFRLYSPGEPVLLSTVLPMLEHMGTRAVGEAAFLVAPEDGPDVWLHDFELELQSAGEVDLATLREPFEEAFGRVWHGWSEDDGFNALVLVAGLDWREVNVLRAYFRYLRQTNAVFSQRYTEATVRRNPEVARLLVRLFKARLDPERASETEAAELRRRIHEALDRVKSLDEDRILRRLLNLVECTLRTNFFQPAEGGEPKPYLSLKLDSRGLEELPKPRPLVEIFVYSPRLEAVHLRGGKVARGGLRWSDRLEDFRSEILGLMKAQMVKNAVIVPVGSKGGFIVKRPPAATGDPAADRRALLQEGIECYRLMQRGLLDLTDNLRDGEVVPPPRVVRHDGDDPYLVVAADKGTATFSDIANQISVEYGHWLGDAYASGGSAGYDHKKMGITARGAWKSVERHFRELGVDVENEDFTAVGVGDMSGDVFGNGMLLSRHIRLVGAFNHLHVFLDPDPDPERSFGERRRLFDDGLGWSEYDPALISAGGGVFDRTAKSLEVSPEVRARLGLETATATPAELIQALLRAPVDLLWFGGIGTYVKADDETAAEVGDRANDALRIDASQVRARVVAEGANLAVTQRGRIQVALAGVRLNTDAIDNSAGVDCSDHEVNIKILLGAVVASGDMTRKQRDELLRAMTEEVAELVLRDNYQQNQAISLTERLDFEALDRQSQFMHALERAGKLDRTIEFLPDDEEIAERLQARRGLTRPEIAVLLAYAKIVLYDALLGSDLPDEELLLHDLVRYFPTPLRERYRGQIAHHPLRREIIATSVTNSMVNRVGPTFVHQLSRDTGASSADVARAYAVTRDAFDLRSLWQGIEDLDNRVPATAQIEMHLEAMALIDRGTRWFLTRGGHPLRMDTLVSDYAPGIRALSDSFESSLSASGIEALEQRRARFTAQGVPAELALKVAKLTELASACDIVRIAHGFDLPTAEVGRHYFAVGVRFGFEWLRTEASQLVGESHWQQLAIRAAIEELYTHQGELTASVLGNGASGSAEEAIDAWIAQRQLAAARTTDLLAELRNAGSLDPAMLVVANRQFRDLIGD